MFSEQTLQEMIYPVGRVIIFIFSTLLIFVFITPFLGYGETYNTMLVEDGVAFFVWIRFLILLTITAMSFGMLFILGKICKRATTKKTYLLLFFILLSIAIYATLAFLDGNLWSYPQETT